VGRLLGAIKVAYNQHHIMPDSPVNSDQLVFPTTATGTAPTPVPTPVIPEPTKPEKVTFVRKLKRVAWRSTAGYLWLRFIFDGIFSGSVPFHSAEVFAVKHLTTYLTSIGFAPGNPDYMLPVVRLGWVLTITGLDPWQFIGFWIYLLFYPASLITFFFFGDQIDQAQTSGANKQGLVKSQQRRVLLPVSTGLIAAWFLLYGNSTSARSLTVGVMLAGVLFLALAFRAFQRARPLTENDIAFASGLNKMTVVAVIDKTRLNPVNRSTAAFNLTIEKFYKSLLVVYAYFFRGKRGKDRMAMYVLVEYVAFLVLLAFSAVLFWGLVIKLMAGPIVSLRQAVLLSTSHFLPGVVISNPPLNMPIWTQVGPALTAWVLFVLFVGPAASLLPIRQEVYGKQIEARYRLFRTYVGAFRKRIRHFRRRRPSSQVESWPPKGFGFRFRVPNVLSQR
jgi:hypothetical protein